MSDCAIHKMRFETSTKLALEAAFDGGRLTSDGGLTWLAEVDTELKVCEAIAEHIPEWRKRRGRHSILSLLKQRVFQIACGYEDQNYCDFLRSDPLLKVVCGALPDSGEDLASQPTICRMENAVDAGACYRIAEALAKLYIAQRAKDGVPQKIVLDFDATDDPTHGDQEESYYHGYFGEHIYHPLVVFDGQTGQLITALLRAGNAHASRSTVAILKRLVGLLRSAWPDVELELRADAGFAVPAVYEYCEDEGISYTIALITNSRLEEMAASVLEEAKGRYEGERAPKVRLLSQGRYQAGSWQIERRVVYKAEVMEEGTKTPASW